MCEPRCRSSMHCRCPIPLAPCSIRCSPCGAVRAFRPAALRRIDFWIGVAGSRAQALAAAGKYREGAAFERIAGAAAVQARAELESSTSTPEDAPNFSASPATSFTPIARCAPRSQILAGNESGPALLWACGISGDLPMVLARIASTDGRRAGRALVARAAVLAAQAPRGGSRDPERRAGGRRG